MRGSAALGFLLGFFVVLVFLFALLFLLEVFVLGGFFGFSLVFFVFLLFLLSVFVLVRAYVRE